MGAWLRLSDDQRAAVERALGTVAIIWAALGALVVGAAAAVLLLPGGDPGPPPLFGPVFLAATLGSAAVGLLVLRPQMRRVARELARQDPSPGPAGLAGYQTMVIAMGDTGAILGVVYRLVGGDQPLALVLVAIAAAYLVYVRPSHEALAHLWAEAAASP